MKLGHKHYKKLLFEVNKKQKATEVSKFDVRKKRIENEKIAYNAYIGHPCRCRTEFLIIAAIAYSWMPTMLNLHFEEYFEWNDLLDLIIKLENDHSVRVDLIKKIAPNCNNSLVGASKILHIIYPDEVPMIDSRVIAGWNHFFKDEINEESILKFPKSININEKNIDKRLKSYIDYWDMLKDWKNNLVDVSMRDLEYYFYYIGDKKYLTTLGQ